MAAAGGGDKVVESYTLGAVIGRGGQAVVHQAWQQNTGSFVAIKKLKVKGPEGSIASEIELLSKLDHPNIVKYIDAVDVNDGHLYIVLEYMENGSLASVLKNFGAFAEPVCAMYIRQVLAGLDYLHTQGVLHRDIKGANILTTKDGVAKLADFGLAARAAAFGSSDAVPDDEVIIGSPYWMAPEIIEMSAAPSAACDIWSLGCTIIELTAGKPPHFDLSPVAALFRIVQDDLPPLPGGLSEALRDFLLQCFHRESVLRAGAGALLGHAWLERARRAEETPTQGAEDHHQTSPAAVAASSSKSSSCALASLSTPSNLPLFSLKSLLRSSENEYSESDEEEEEPRLSNSDLDAFLVDEIRHLQPPQGNVEEDWGKFDDDEEEEYDAGPRVRASSSVVYDENRLLASLQTTATEDDEDVPFFDDFGVGASERIDASSGSRQHADSGGKGRLDKLSRFREEDEDFDVGLDIDGDDQHQREGGSGGFANQVKRRSRYNQAAKASFDEGEEDEFTSSTALSNRLSEDSSVGDPFASCLFDDEKDFIHDDAVERETRRMEEVETLLARLGREDYVVAQGGEGTASLAKTEAACAALKRLIDRSQEDDTAALLLSEHATSSLLEAVERSLERHSVVAAAAVLKVVDAVCRRGNVESVVALGLTPLLARLTTELLLPSSDEARIAVVSVALARVAATAEYICTSGSDETLRSFISGGGLGLLSSLLLPDEDFDATLVIDVQRWSAAKVAVDAILSVLRREARKAIWRPKSSSSFSDLPAVVALSRPSRNAICLTLARLDAPPRLAAGLAAATQLEDAARRALARSDDDAARRRISRASVLAERSAAALCAFCEADTHVRERVALSRTVRVLLAVLAAAPKRVDLMTQDRGLLASEADAHASLAVSLVKALKALCMASAEALDALASAGAIEVVVDVLLAAECVSIGQGQMFPRRDELEDQLVPCLYYLCRIERTRLARAAACGAASLLAACVERRRHLKQFALAILCEMCHAASSSSTGPEAAALNNDDGDNTIAAELWKAGGVRLYSRLLAEAYWGVRALAALAAWLARDATRRVEEELATPPCAERVVALLRGAQRAEFEHALPPLRDALERSPRFAAALLCVGGGDGGGTQEDTRQRRRRHAFAREIGRRLRRHTSAIVRKALIEILRAALKAAESPRRLLSEADLVDTLEKLGGGGTGQVLVRDLANSLISAKYADD